MCIFSIISLGVFITFYHLFSALCTSPYAFKVIKEEFELKMEKQKAKASNKQITIDLDADDTDENNNNENVDDDEDSVDEEEEQDMDMLGNEYMEQKPQTLQIIDKLFAKVPELATVNANFASHKLYILKSILVEAHIKGEKTLIFSHSVRVLETVRRFLESIGLNKKFVLKLDGRVSSSKRRMEIVNKFNTDTAVRCLLISKLVGGIGLTLTAATRVIFLDLNWNPTRDDQAAARAFRIGQTRDVFVYRLIMDGTFEESMYTKSLQKKRLIEYVTQYSSSCI